MAAEVERELYGHRLDAMVGMDDDGLTDEQIDAYAEWTRKREAELFNPDGTRRLSSTVDIDLTLVELAERTYKRDQRGRFARTGAVRPVGEPRERPKAPLEPGRGQRSLPGMSKAGRQPAEVKERAELERRYKEHPYLADVDAKQAQIRSDLHDAPDARDADGFVVPGKEPTVAPVDIRKPPNDRFLVVRNLNGDPVPGAGLEAAEAHTRELGHVVDGEIRRRYAETGLRHPDEVEAEYDDLNRRAGAVKERYVARTGKAVAKARKTHPGFDDGTDWDQDYWINEADPTLGSDYDKEWAPLLARHNQLVDERAKTQNAYSRVSRQVFSEVRPGFGTARYSFNRKEAMRSDNVFGTDLTQYAGLPRAKLRSKMDEAASHLPREWVDASNGNNGVVVIPADLVPMGRGGVSGWSMPVERNKPGAIGMPEAMLRPGDPTAVHELTHRAENTVPDVNLLEWQFYSRRTLTSTPHWGVKDPLVREAMGEYEGPQSLRALKDSKTLGPREIARPDNFTEPYAGRMYSNDHSAWSPYVTLSDNPVPDSDFEVATTAVEAVMYGRGSIDQDHRDFMTGVLASV